MWNTNRSIFVFLTFLFHQVHIQTWYFTRFRISDTSSTDTSKPWAWRTRDPLTHPSAVQADSISRGIDIVSPRALSCSRQARRTPRRLSCRGARQGSGRQDQSSFTSRNPARPGPTDNPVSIPCSTHSLKLNVYLPYGISYAHYSYGIGSIFHVTYNAMV